MDSRFRPQEAGERDVSELEEPASRGQERQELTQPEQVVERLCEVEPPLETPLEELLSERDVHLEQGVVQHSRGLELLLQEPLRWLPVGDPHLGEVEQEYCGGRDCRQPFPLLVEELSEMVEEEEEY